MRFISVCRGSAFEPSRVAGMNEVVTRQTIITGDVSSAVLAILSLVNSFGVPNSDGGERRDKKVCQEDV